MLMRSFVIWPIVILTGCQRAETPEYFEKITGLPLCSSASVTNINDTDPERSPGFDSIYIVDVRADAACRVQLIRSVEEVIAQKCGDGDCSGLDADGQFIRLEKRGSTLRVTFST